MSTPKWKKDLRLKQQAEAKRKREFDKKYGIGSVKASKPEFKPLKLKTLYVRETPEIKSLHSTAPITGTAVEKKEYTGTLVKGIATMHKSNAVPVINDEQAKDLARMRRG